MFGYACTLLSNEADAEEIVQTVFLKLWEKRQLLTVETSVKAYLYRAVHNDCMNWLKHNAVVKKFQKEKAYLMKSETDNNHKKLLASQLEDKLLCALQELPERCRTIFQLSRFEELKYKEIATQLNISEKTVENQMGKALKGLRARLIDFLPLLLCFIFIV